MELRKRVIATILALMIMLPFIPVTVVHAYEPKTAYKNAQTLPLNTTITVTNNGSHSNQSMSFFESSGYYKIELPEKGSLQFIVNGILKGNGEDSNWYFVLYDSSLKRLGASRDFYCSTVQNEIFDFGTQKKGTYYLQVYAPWGAYTTLSGDLTIQYVPASVPQLNKKSTSITKGSTLQLKLKNAPKGTIQWISGRKAVATVDKKGKVTAKGKGTAVIFAIIENKAYKCTVKVSE